jgi:ABC-2 type transport system permease protein
VRNILLICKKEIKGYFSSPIAYVVIGLFGLIFGTVFYNSVKEMMRYTFQAQMMGQQQQMNVNDFIIRPLLGFAHTVGLFVFPFITMRLVAEEKRTGTIELLLTSPVKDSAIIIGKYLGALFLWICALGMSALSVAFLFAWGKPDLKPVLVSYLGLILQGAALLALGVFFSTVTRNQIVAAVATFFAQLMLWLMSWFTGFETTWPYKVLNYMSVVTHMENLNKGILDLKDVVFYASVIFFGLFLSSRSMESLRWRA